MIDPNFIKIITKRTIDTNDISIKSIVRQQIQLLGNNADLNHIDVSEVTDMDSLFKFYKFNGDISRWDISKVVSMYSMFYDSKFDGDISKWNVSNVESVASMFCQAEFSGDLSK